ncbi:MAG: ribosome biogenesis GTPase Der [Alphaproteobacteria bacterium]|nr:ribosome biogenesis GTPase Der [Alphaproteobacteria bacterium]
MTFTVAIIGRPNVGKSTLFNRLVGRREAIVDRTPGVTRDRREGKGRLGDLRFTVVDTAGLEEPAGDALLTRMRAQTETALEDADVGLLLIDARTGLIPLDHHFADWLRPQKTPVILIANKCEGRGGGAGFLEAYALGLGDPLPISAEHGEGMADLWDALAPYAAQAATAEAPEPAQAGAGAEDGPLQLAIVGRPTVGKSTLVNRLLGEERMVTGPDGGVTRDAISVSWTFEGRAIRLIDTAGLRRKAKITEKVEGLSVGNTLRAIRFAHVVVLVMDVQAILEKQDLSIARLVAEEGRALVIAVNKWDVADDRKGALRRLADRLQTSLPQLRGVAVLTFSALTGDGVDRLLPAVLGAFQVWNRRIGTAPLNRWLADAGERHPPPLAGGRRNRLRYITQAKARPPTFVLFASRPEELPESYLRYLVNGLRDAFDLPGVPVRLHPRKGDNPYTEGR